MPNRRDFILQTCSFCAAVAGLGIIAAELESCKTSEGMKVTVTKTQISVPLKIFGDQKNYLVKDFNLPYDILVVKHSDETYTALQMRCTHKNYALRLAPDSLICDNHGSKFDFDGNVTKDPATRPLTKYPCSVEGKTIVVNLTA